MNYYKDGPEKMRRVTEEEMKRLGYTRRCERYTYLPPDELADKGQTFSKGEYEEWRDHMEEADEDILIHWVKRLTTKICGEWL